MSIIPCLLCNCTSDSNESIRNIFELVIVKDDLESIINDTPKKDLMDSSYYYIVSYEENKKGRYTKIAEVDYFFLKNVKVKISRKYRYVKRLKKWERYTNEYKFYTYFEQAIVRSDFESMKKDIPKKDLMDSPYYKIVSYEENKNGQYTKNAEVDYFYLKNEKVKISRKYRYDKKIEKWERYTNEKKHFD